MSQPAQKVEIGHIEALYRYPVKSMRGEPLETATLGWRGLEGDRRLALRRVDPGGGYPWLTASKLPELILFTPALPAAVVTPEGHEMALFGDALAADVARRHGAAVEMVRHDDGIFDDESISVITSDTVREVCGIAGQPADARRFRPNIVVRCTRPAPFAEDAWVGGVLTFGDGADAPAVAATARDVRCAMVNLDPATARATPQVLKAVARANDSHAGIYAAVKRVGRVAVGQTVLFHPVT